MIASRWADSDAAATTPMQPSSPHHADAPWVVPGASAVQPVEQATTTTSSGAPSPTRVESARGWGRLRRRTVGEILDGGFEVLRYRFVTLVALSSTFALPLYAVPTLLRVTQAHLIAGGSDEQRNAFEMVAGVGTSSGVSPWLTWLSLIGNGLALAFIGVAVAHLVGEWTIGGDPSYRETLGLVVRRSPVLLGAWLMALGIKALGVVALCVGWVFVIPLLMVLSPVVASEHLGPVASVRRCWRLSSRRYAMLLGLTLVSAVVAWVVQVVLSAIAVGLLSIWASASWLWIAVSVVGVAVELVMLPLAAAWAALAYLDLRVRTEGLDLELEITELFGPA
jgi:hypothetical protein